MLDKKIITLLYQRDNWKCRSCCNRTLHPHHVKFKGQGGKDDIRNLLTLCPSCHAGIHDRKLIIHVLGYTSNNIIVRFERKKGWKP